MGLGSRLQAKGEFVPLKVVCPKCKGECTKEKPCADKCDNGEVEQKIMVVPLDNDQFIEAQTIIQDGMKTRDEGEESKKAMEAVLKITRDCLNNGVREGESSWSEEEVKKMPTNFLMDIFDVVLKINKLEKMFDFQAKGQKNGQSTPGATKPTSAKTIFQELNNNPAKKLGS